jgi:hypothetical protein
MSNNYNSALEELDRLQSNYNLRDPRTAPSEVEKIVAEEMSRAGLKPASPKSEHRNEEYRARVYAAAEKFVVAHPVSDLMNGFEPSAANERLLFDWIEENGMDGTEPHHFELAFAALRGRLVRPAKPNRSGGQIRKVDGITISHDSLDRLSAKELDKLLQNPRAVQLINELPPRSR